MLIAVINQSTLVSNQDVNTMCLAIQVQLDLHVLPAWEMTRSTIEFFADATKVPGYAWLVTMMDNSTQAGALGYHAEDSGRVDGFIFAEPVLSSGGVALFDATNPQNVSVSSVLSHEVCEMIGDRYANFWAMGPEMEDQDGHVYSQYALELCDPVEGDSYSVEIKVNGVATLVSLSNFVFPSWFNAQATEVNMPFDYLKKLNAPFSMTAGGYIILGQSGDVTQIFGDKVSEATKTKVKAEWYRR